MRWDLIMTRSKPRKQYNIYNITLNSVVLYCYCIYCIWKPNAHGKRVSEIAGGGKQKKFKYNINWR